MRFEETSVTPEVARQWMTANAPFNRPIKRQRVGYFRRMLETSCFETTSQGITFGTSGFLIDGQHRLAAIASMPEDFSVRLVVAYEVEDATYDAFDQGSRRQFSDVIGAPTGLIAVANSISYVYYGLTTPQSSIAHVRYFSNAMESSFEDLLTGCKSTRPSISSSAVRAAACLQMRASENADYVTTAYRALVQQQYGAMTPTIQLFNKQIGAAKDGKGAFSRGKAGQKLTMLRAFKAFDPAAQNLEQLKIVNETTETERLRDVIEKVVFRQADPCPPGFVRPGSRTKPSRQELIERKLALEERVVRRPDLDFNSSGGGAGGAVVEF